MAKVKPEIIEAAVYSLVDRINATMPNSMYRFLIGGTASLMQATSGGKVKNAIAGLADKNGLVDTDIIRKTYESAFKASDGRLQIELFNRPGCLLNLFVKPVTVTITKKDIDDIMKEVEQNSVVEEVSLGSAIQQVQTE